MPCSAPLFTLPTDATWIRCGYAHPLMRMQKPRHELHSYANAPFICTTKGKLTNGCLTVVGHPKPSTLDLGEVDRASLASDA